MRVRATVAECARGASSFASRGVPVGLWKRPRERVCTGTRFLKELLPSLFTHKNIDHYQEGQI